ncbi:hypothetical protein [Nitrosomonas aestuarii]|uniref:hypothetical protein n=1 Tax=Nitrosomonas aestuarii TaxID=52441 RepID=UPI001FD5DF39|nr:hypothetical protein [Nitrosomonas aestuarii]
MEITLKHGDALIIVDVQNDFLSDGSLPVPGEIKLFRFLIDISPFFMHLGCRFLQRVIGIRKTIVLFKNMEANGRVTV